MHTSAGEIAFINAEEKATPTLTKMVVGLLTTEDNKPVILAFECFNEFIKMMEDIKIGDTVIIHFTIRSTVSKKSSSRGKYFTALKAVKIEKQTTSVFEFKI